MLFFKKLFSKISDKNLSNRRNVIRLGMSSIMSFFILSSHAESNRSNGGQSSDDNINSITSLEDIIYAEKYGVVNSSIIDSSDALELLLQSSAGKVIQLPANFSVSRTIKYPSVCHIKGIDVVNSKCWILPGFSGFSVFEPVLKDKLSSLSISFSSLTFSDLGAKNDGRGTTSNINAINVTGTFAARLNQLKGVRVNSLIYCEAGKETQQTARTWINDLDGSNINFIVNFEPCADDRLPYGDLYLSNIKTTGSIKYGVRIEDTDGLTWIGAVLFPDASIRISGHYLNLSLCHPFEPKARIGDNEFSAEALLIAPRLGGGKSHYVTISNFVSAFSGRLSNSARIKSSITNQGAFGMKLVGVINFNLSAIVNDPSMGALHLIDCTNGTFTLASQNVNTQQLGTGALAAGSYDVLVMEKCDYILGQITDLSPSKRYLVNMDESCNGCFITAVCSQGAHEGLPYIIPKNKNNIVNILYTAASGTMFYNTSKDQVDIAKATLNDPYPAISVYKPGIYLVFDNNQKTEVKDILCVENYQDLYINISDNYTTILDVSNGGKFRLNGNNRTGRGTILHLVREPSSGELCIV